MPDAVRAPGEDEDDGGQAEEDDGAWYEVEEPLLGGAQQAAPLGPVVAPLLAAGEALELQ